MSAFSNPWLRIGFDAWSLGLESSSVIGLRTAKFALGGVEAEREARQMIAEKMDAGLALQRLALTGALGLTAPRIAARTLSHYRGKVRANQRRLRKA